jgi:hypothetical protein
MFHEKFDELRELAGQLLDHGYRVFVPGEPYWQTYLFYSDGIRIAYAQQTRYDGVTFTTVHRPNRECGTGFQSPVYGTWLENAARALHELPHYAAAYRSSISRYRDLEEFLASRPHAPLVELSRADLDLPTPHLKEPDPCR